MGIDFLRTCGTVERCEGGIQAFKGVTYRIAVKGDESQLDSTIGGY